MNINTIFFYITPNRNASEKACNGLCTDYTGTVWRLKK